MSVFRGCGVGSVVLGLGVLGGASGLAMGDTAGCIQASLLGELSPNGQLKRDVAVLGSTAFVTAGTNGVFAIDVSDPGAMMVVGSYDTPSTADGIVVVDGLAYVADSAQGFHILDVSDPSNMVLVGGADTPGFATNIFVEDGVAYVADQFSVQIFDVSDPSMPSYLGEYGATGNGYEDVFVVGSMIYAANRFSGFEILDGSDLTNPVGLGQSPTPRPGMGVKVSGDTLYLAAGDLRIFDVQNRSSPVEVGDLSVACLDLDVDGCVVFAAGNGLPPNDGLAVIDVRDPTMPAVISRVRPFGCVGVVQDSGVVYAVAEGRGLGVIGLTECVADLNCDGSLNFLDVSLFLQWFGKGDPSADVTGDGSYNFLDVSAFLAAFGMGCP